MADNSNMIHSLWKGGYVDIVKSETPNSGKPKASIEVKLPNIFVLKPTCFFSTLIFKQKLIGINLEKKIMSYKLGNILIRKEKIGRYWPVTFSHSNSWLPNSCRDHLHVLFMLQDLGCLIEPEM